MTGRLADACAILRANRRSRRILRLPGARGRTPDAAGRRQRRPGWGWPEWKAFMPTRIIIAEDDAVIRMDLKEELQRQGYLVVGDVGDGQSAVTMARELRPELVVMDIRMPEMDGISAAEILTREKLAPVLLLTAFSDEELIERARSAGVVHYVTKPWRQSDLKPAIEIALSRFQEFRELEGRVKNLEDQLATRKVVEKAKGVLMEKYKLSEQEAFRRIQKLSMNNRKSMKEVAEAILLADELNVK
jgi:two-component system, response regulator PdtaR